MGKNINICAVKKCDKHYIGSCKKLSGGGKNKNTHIGETPPTWNFLFVPPPPPQAPTLLPRRTPTMISTHFIPIVREKLNQGKIFLALSLNFLGGSVAIVSNTQNFIYQ